MGGWFLKISVVNSTQYVTDKNLVIKLKGSISLILFDDFII